MISIPIDCQFASTCSWLLEWTHSAAAPALFPYEIMREHLKPVFTSELRNDGQDIVVAMLAEIVHEDKSQNDKQEEEFANFIDECLGRRFAAEGQTPDGRIIQCPTGCFQPDAGIRPEDGRLLLGNIQVK